MLSTLLLPRRRCMYPLTSPIETSVGHCVVIKSDSKYSAPPKETARSTLRAVGSHVARLPQSDLKSRRLSALAQQRALAGSPRPVALKREKGSEHFSARGVSRMLVSTWSEHSSRRTTGIPWINVGNCCHMDAWYTGHAPCLYVFMTRNGECAGCWHAHLR